MTSLFTDLVRVSFLRTIFVVTVGTIFLGVFLQNHVVHPQFAELLIQFVEDEARRTARHITAYQGVDDLLSMRHLSPAVLQEIPQTIDHFNLEKIKIFDDRGVVVFSNTPTDIGVQNTREYFISSVKKGHIYSKVVQRDDVTLEGRTVQQDVVEVYVPIMRQGRFVGAFEIYYDVTGKNHALHALMRSTSHGMYLFGTLMAIILLIVLRKAGKEMHHRSLMEAKLKQMAHYDGLTNLPNRVLFHELLQREIVRAKRERLGLAVFFMDLDRFKQVNDTHGHGVGDLLLCEVAARLTGCLRACDTVSRLGGDEFTIILPKPHSRQKIQGIATRVIHQLTMPFVLQGCECQIGTSIGIALYPDHADAGTHLVKCADQAMYRVKQAGRNNYQFYQSVRNRSESPVG